MVISDLKKKELQYCRSNVVVTVNDYLFKRNDHNGHFLDRAMQNKRWAYVRAILIKLGAYIGTGRTAVYQVHTVNGTKSIENVAIRTILNSDYNTRY